MSVVAENSGEATILSSAKLEWGSKAIILHHGKLTNKEDQCLLQFLN